MNDLLSIYALGGLRIVCGNHPITGISSRKAEALLIYLAHTSQPQPRDILAEMFWPERTQTRSLSSLRVTLTHLRKALAPYISVTRQTLAIHPDRPVWLDVQELDDQIDLLARSSDEFRLLSQADAETLEQTLDLYQGGLLAGFHVRGCPAFESWSLEERERLQRLVTHALDALIRYDLRTGRWSAGIQHASRLLQLDPLHEPGHRHLIQCLASSGQRDAALAQYQTCKSILADELGAEPDEATTQLFENIQSGDVTGADIVPAPRHNLPAQLTSFVGRKSEMAEVSRLLAERRLVTLIGPGGIGKTRLALEAAALQAAHFTHGVFFVPLVGLGSGAEIVPAIADAVGFRFAAGSDGPQVQLFNHLRHRHVLLVLDNFEHLLDSAILVSDLLRTAPDVKVLATSRERLSLSGEAVILLGGLELPESDAQNDLLQHDAVRLFFEHVWQVQHGSDSDADALVTAARICRLLDGMPLGILLAATWTNTLSLEEIAHEIVSGLDFLAADVRDIPPRHRSLRAVFESSWRRLEYPERDALMRLAVFRNGFSRAAAQQVTGASLRTLNRLVSRSLVRRRPDSRYDIHELLRQFADEKLADDPEMQQTTQDRHCAHYAELLHQREADIRHGNLHVVETDLDNIRAMWAYAVKTANHHAIHIAATSINWLCQRRAMEAEGLAFFTAASEALRRIPQPGSAQQIALGLTLAYQGFFAYRRGDSVMGKRCLEQSRALLRAIQAPYELAIALITSGYCGDDVETCDGYFEEGIAIFEEIGQEWGVQLGWKLRTLVVLFPQNRLDEIEQRMQAALAYDQAIGNHSGINYSLAMLSQAAVSRQAYDSAEQYTRQAIMVSEAAGLRRNEVENYWSLGRILTNTGDYDAARQAMHKSLDLHTEYGIDSFVDLIHAELGHIAIAQHNAEEASRQFCLALQTGKYPETRLSAAIGHALLAGRAGNTARAAEWLSALKQADANVWSLQQWVDSYLDEITQQMDAPAFLEACQRADTVDLALTVDTILDQC